jgi:broad specificity phosphatase PhoE
MKLFIIRHAQSENNVHEGKDYEAYMRNRVVDPSITALGFKQAERVAQHLAAQEHAEHVHENGEEGSGYRFTHIFASPMLRCLQTALPISKALNIAPEVWVDIHEQGGMFLGNPRTGEDLRFFPGMTRNEIEAQFTGYRIPETISDSGWWTGGHEEHTECEQRAERVAIHLRKMAAEMADARVAIVSHGTFSDRLVKALVGLPTNTSQCYFTHYNTAITRVDFWGEGNAFVRYLNRVQHLPPEMVSM